MISSKISSGRFRFRDNAWLPGPLLIAGFALGVGVLLLGAWMERGWSFFVLYNGFLLLLALVDMGLLRGTSRITVRRECDAVWELEKDHRVRLVLFNPLPFALPVKIRDDYPEGFRIDRRTMAVVVPPKKGAEAVYTARPHRRGRHRFDRIHLRFTGLLRLVIRQRAFDAGEERQVFPPLDEVRRIRGGVYRKALSRSGAHSRRSHERGSDFSHTREYVPDDEPKMINWTASARRGRLVTNVYQPEQGQLIAILLDCGRVMGVREKGVTRFDRSLEAALGLAAIALERGDQVSLLAFSNRIHRWVPPGKGSHHLQRFIQATFDLEPDLSESDYRTALESLALRQKRRSLVTLFTDADNLIFANDLMQYLAVLKRRHLVLTVSIQNPFLQRQAEMRPEQREAVFRKAVAQELQREREERLNRMRREGMIALDAPSDRLAPAVIHTYLDVKNRSAL